MRTVREMARLLGWPEAHRMSDHVHYPLPATPRPKVIVWRTRPGHWGWVIGHRISIGMVELDGPYGHAPTQPAALALGLAALDTASVRRP